MSIPEAVKLKLSGGAWKRSRTHDTGEALTVLGIDSSSEFTEFFKFIA